MLISLTPASFWGHASLRTARGATPVGQTYKSPMCWAGAPLGEGLEGTVLLAASQQNLIGLYFFCCN